MHPPVDHTCPKLKLGYLSHICKKKHRREGKSRFAGCFKQNKKHFKLKIISFV